MDAGVLAARIVRSSTQAFCRPVQAPQDHQVDRVG
jgi:hypothetical protein